MSDTTATVTAEASSQPALMDNDTNLFFHRIAVYFNTFEPTGTISFSYLTEGAANTIWNVRFSHDSNLSQHDSAVVLRMRKDIPSTIPMLGLKEQFEERIAPLFFFDPSLLLPVQLIQLGPGVIEDMNQQLHHLENTKHRKAMRTGAYHPSFEIEPYAMLMPNLIHGLGKVVEFKPKWLVQSPSAPRDAQRCRTCALNAMRRAKGVSGRGDSGFCPFDMLSSNEKILSSALRNVWSENGSLLDFVTAFRVKVQPALRQLQKLQRQHSDVGLEDFLNPAGKDFSVAMALRDCSIVLKVVKVPHDDTRLHIPIVKLLDLDLKDAGGGKLAKWARMEAELIEDGWYTTKADPSIRCAMAFQ
ncbi:Inositol-pentakisphosphate 2-kinase [Knufia obscura]|uniref:Inositol-pentakisphosphate 2-kinase n=2 Tax=Knufia TaxID=430999 RepID=A0AAN8IIJ0_9EURO|nr:Inositol-pentakisphosphate 2-kinase [Knufia obscura]KAK5949162.1 Inositol-pentakisphosphate 2-kinase [Knufia fluminis]